MNEHISPEFEAQLQELLATPDADTAFVDRLRSRLMQGSRVKISRRFSPRLAWGLAVVGILLIIGSLALNPQVVQAMKRLLGYIPGVGYVEKRPGLRVLSEPAKMQKDGLTVTIEQGVADPQRTVLLARVEGYPAGRSGPPTCKQFPQLVLSDGSVERMAQATSSPDVQNEAVLFVRYEFQPMPAGPLDATLEIPCLMLDANFKDWSIPLHFRVAQAMDQGAPVIELPSAIPTESVSTGAPTPGAESAPAGFSIVLQSVAELPDGYVLSGRYQWSDTSIDRSAVVISDSNILDANGQPVPYEEVGSDPSTEPGPHQILFAYQITAKDMAWPLNLVVNAISVVQPGQGTFQFDAGQAPIAGQTWDVNIDAPIGRHIIHVETIQLTGDIPGLPNMLGYAFTMTSDPDVAGATVEEPDAIIECKGGCGGGGGGIDAGPSGTTHATGPFYYGTKANGYVPAGVKTFVISNVSVFFRGPWQISWQPSSP